MLHAVFYTEVSSCFSVEVLDRPTLVRNAILTQMYGLITTNNHFAIKLT